MIELFTANTPNGWKISIMLEEIGYKYKITKVDIKLEDFNKNIFRDKVNFLLSSSLAEMKRRGSLTNEIKLSSDSFQELRNFLNNNDKTNFELEAVSMINSKTAQPVIVELNINNPES